MRIAFLFVVGIVCLVYLVKILKGFPNRLKETRTAWDNAVQAIGQSILKDFIFQAVLPLVCGIFLLTLVFSILIYLSVGILWSITLGLVFFLAVILIILSISIFILMVLEKVAVFLLDQFQKEGEDNDDEDREGPFGRISWN